eukprot:CAMPEP_0169130784 /NCGR_PEP_ID=MMETSP1015-20121227/37894_1 /TAXON_ID=342587 /ORGANISM="Karlodinium micrum, Strain CCMP2283" /LENGTH=274 /DNA_ID=CAMNT_0009194993 /DNA_START=45 /DNA_END=869 /DNA_ORIENTATION=+
MGNTCAQDCDALNHNKTDEATFDMNSERALPEYQKVSVLSSRTSPSNLPRLGLGTQNQELPSKRRPSSAGMQQPEPMKVTFGAEEHIDPLEDLLLLPPCPPDDVLSRDSFQLKEAVPAEKCVDISLDANLPPTVGPEETRDDASVIVKSAPVQEQPVQESPFMEQHVEPLVQDKALKVVAPTTSPALELTFDVKGEKKCIILHRRPLGAEFTKRMRALTKIDKIHPRSYASELGMEVGWIIQAVGGEDVTKKSFTEVQMALKHGMMALPLHDGL